MGVVIDTPQLLMEIKFVAVDSLFTHEETIPTALEQLKQELLDECILKHPIIVDTDTYVVLDGMHRVAALKSLNCKIIPVCLVDYQNPAIELFAWYREFEGNVPFEDFLDQIRLEEKYNHSQISSMEAPKVVDKRDAMAALARGKTAFLLKHTASLTIKEVYDKIAAIEIIAQRMGYKIIYSTKTDALQNLQSERCPVLVVPPLTKKEVVQCALQHQLFAQKTTRHVVPARPLFTNVPLSWLKTTNLTKTNQQLYAHLNSKQIIKKEPGSIIDGRRYEERAYLFSDS
jgi:hypothetical protein